MRHIFIINPLAGRKGGKERLKRELYQAGEKLGVQAEVYETQYQGDGGRFVRECCALKEPGEKLRFYAVGGDGALNEIVNGAFGTEDVEIGCVPLGTGNDYVRNYAKPRAFLDIEGQLLGKGVRQDLIQYRIELGGKKQPWRYCVNMFNIGFDCNVVDQTGRVKNWPFVSGSFAYLLSVAIVLIKKKGANLKVCYEDGTVFDGKLLLIAVANGCFCGGGVKGVPLAKPDDGLMDVSLIRDVTRRTFVRLFPKYAKGTHLEDKRMSEIIDYVKCRSLTIYANGGAMRLCTDGEIADADQVDFEVVPEGLVFSVPKGVWEK